MIGPLLILLAPLVLALVVRAAGDGERKGLLPLLLGGFALRILVQVFLRDLPLFSYGTGGDYLGYEALAIAIAKTWEHTGLEYVTQEQVPELGQTSLPPNLFALIIYANGSPTRYGCVAIVALATCLTAYNLYRLCLDLGAAEKGAMRVLSLFLFASPAVLMYTSEMFKDGLVLLCVTGALGASFRLSRKFTGTQVFLGVLSLVALWHVRFYLCFIVVIPLGVGLFGFGGRSLRPAFLGLVLSAGLLLAGSTAGRFGTEATEHATTTFEGATAENSLDSNASGGSGVTFNDGGSPLGAIGPKLLYTIFAPFPWQRGSLALHIGKIESLLFMYCIYRAWRAGRRLWYEEPSLLLMFISFLVPTTVMYATIMSNVGLIVRERMPIVAMTAVLASLSWVKERASYGAEVAKEAPKARRVGVRNAIRRLPGRRVASTS